jgi:hypothetical protein
MVSGIRIDEQERVRATLERGAGNEPGLEDRLCRFRLCAPVDQVQAGAVAADCTQESGQQILVARRRSLCDDGLAMTDAEVRQLESIGGFTAGLSYARIQLSTCTGRREPSRCENIGKPSVAR